MIRIILKELLCYLRGEVSLRRLKKRGLKVGERFNMMGGVILDPSHCWLIKIGNNVTLAPRVHILAHDASTKIFLNFTRIGRVNIGDNVFIGASTIVLPNVKIGNNVVIGANSTVTTNLDSNGVYAGSPAKFICTIDEFCSKNKEKLISNPPFEKEYTLDCSITQEMKIEMIELLKDKEGFVV